MKLKPPRELRERLGGGFNYYACIVFASLIILNFAD